MSGFILSKTCGLVYDKNVKFDSPNIVDVDRENLRIGSK